MLTVSSLTVAKAPSSGAAVDSRYGGTLRISSDSFFNNFCIGTSTTNSLGIIRSVYDTLVERSADDELVPYLASSVVPNTTRTEWTISLRPGILYHDGTSFDATNVKLNLDSIRGAKWGTSGDGWVPHLIHLSYSNVLDVVVVDGLTVKVVLELPQVDFLETLYAGGRAAMRATAQLNNRLFCYSSAIGTGPFMVVSKTNELVELDRNPNYWRRDPNNGNQLPYLDHISVAVVRDSSLRSQSIVGVSGAGPTADLAFYRSREDSTEIISLRKNYPQLAEFKSRNETLQALYQNVGLSGSPSQSKNARLALAYATDTTKILSDVYNGLGEVPTSVMPQRSQLYTPKNLIHYDFVKAREYVSRYKAETGLDNLSVTVGFENTPSDTDLAQALKTMWGQAGIILNDFVAEPAIIVSKTFRTGAQLGSQFQVSKVGIGYGSESGFHTQFMRSNAYNPNTINPVYTAGGGLVAYSQIYKSLMNVSQHGNSEVDTKLLSAQSELKSALSSKKYREAIAYYQDQAYEIPLPHSFFTAFMNPKVRGLGQNYISPGIAAKGWIPLGPDLSTVYLSSSSTKTITTVNNSNFVGKGWIGANPQGIALMDSSSAYVARTEEGEICLFSFASGTSSSCVDVGGKPVALVLNAAHSALYFVDRADGRIRRLSVPDGATSTLGQSSCLPSAIAVYPSETAAFVACPDSNTVKKVDLIRAVVLAEISVSNGPSGVVVEPGGKAIWVSQSLTNTVIRIELDQTLVSQNLTKDSSRVVRLSNIAVSRSVLETKNISVGSNPSSLSISSDGRFLYVVNENDDTISRIETSTGTVSNAIPAGEQPRFLAVDTESNNAYVANVYSNMIGVVALPAITPEVKKNPVAKEPVSIVPFVVDPVEKTPAIDTPIAKEPTVTVPITGNVSTTKPVWSPPKVTMKKSATAKSIAIYAKLKLLSTSKISMKVVSTYAKYCKVSGTALKGLKAGSCKVTVTVTPKKGKATSKTVTLKVTK